MTPSVDDVQAIPTYQIDLDLPPNERYKDLATELGPRMRAITPLFNEVLASVIPWASLCRIIEFFSSIVLRRVFSNEETKELKGISKASGVDMYILVALNVLLDSLLGCTSGGVMVREKKRKGKQVVNEKRDPGTMMHFRTLDWGMDGLRDVLVVLEFVRSKSEEPEKVIARAITYAGFVGVLTGVRENLSISLNFRPNHTCSTLRLRAHQALVLFGFRPSVTSILRSTFLPSSRDATIPPLGDSVGTLSLKKTAPCYLTLCDGNQTFVIEKDLATANIRTSDAFIVITNHDTEPSEHIHDENEKHSPVAGMEAWVEESEERRACIQRKWDGMKRRHEKKLLINGEGAGGGGPSVREETLKKWVKAYPIMNECSHFGCIMDPGTGIIRFLERGVDRDDGMDDPDRPQRTLRGSLEIGQGGVDVNEPPA
ncbi:hypothetical protein G7Y89_g5740 [Cudoniella acicularis]|uniref:ceramidase n=1 Tax=Cudoniella acicularis TaxID=354080 RepID=A0A8H4RP83_9HELO|nr:hypothetical protein G7Y89_g5740 [Cudoniella acicularis]